jgi:hypothetical protein
VPQVSGMTVNQFMTTETKAADSLVGLAAMPIQSLMLSKRAWRCKMLLASFYK